MKKEFLDYLMVMAVDLVNLFGKIVGLYVGVFVLFHGLQFFSGNIIGYFDHQLEVAGPDSPYARFLITPAPAIILLTLIAVSISLIFTGARTKVIKDTPTWAQFRAQLQDNKPKDEKETVDATSTPVVNDPKSQS
jgi:hypothetical protein